MDWVKRVANIPQDGKHVDVCIIEVGFPLHRTAAFLPPAVLSWLYKCTRRSPFCSDVCAPGGVAGSTVGRYSGRY